MIQKVIKTPIKRFSSLSPNAQLTLVLTLVLIERLIAMAQLGVNYNLESDDIAYLNSGIFFSKTGTVSIHSQEPTAMVMPGMAVFIGAFAKLFGTSTLLIFALKLTWIFMGTLSALGLYCLIKQFASHKCALVGVAFFLSPHLSWMHNLLLTETPYYFFLIWFLYFTARLTKHEKISEICGFSLTFFGMLMLRSAAFLLLGIALIYLLFCRTKPKTLLLCFCTLLILISSFMIPWSIRNQKHFQTFIPFSYGIGHPTLEGTYQGLCAPPDDDLDYQTNVTLKFQEKYAKFLDENGEAKTPVLKQYLSDAYSKIKADYRMKAWFAENPLAFLFSYLLLKPLYMLGSVFYWQPTLGMPIVLQYTFRILGTLLFLYCIYLSHKHDYKRKTVFFFANAYFFVSFTTALSFAFERYAEPFMVFRYLVICIMLPILKQEYLSYKQKRAAK